MFVFKSMKYVFILALAVFLLSGCDSGGNRDLGGGTGSQKTTTPVINPDDNSDKYDVSEIIEGVWSGTSGTGSATGYDGTYDLSFYSCLETFSNFSTISRNNEWRVFVHGYHTWDAFNKNGEYATTVQLSNYNSELIMTHIGGDSWRCEYPDGYTAIHITSPTTALVTQEGVADVDGIPYNYIVSMNVKKESYTNNQNSDDNSDKYDISEIIEGVWSGISGTGSATGYDGTYDLSFYSSLATLSDFSINSRNNRGFVKCYGYQTWDAFNQNGEYATTVQLSSHNDELTMTHTGGDSWRCEYPNGAILTIHITSPTTALVTQEGVTYVNGISYNYVVNMNVEKKY